VADQDMVNGREILEADSRGRNPPQLPHGDRLAISEDRIGEDVDTLMLNEKG